MFRRCCAHGRRSSPEPTTCGSGYASARSCLLRTKRIASRMGYTTRRVLTGTQKHQLVWLRYTDHYARPSAVVACLICSTAQGTRWRETCCREWSGEQLLAWCVLPRVLRSIHAPASSRLQALYVCRREASVPVRSDAQQGVSTVQQQQQLLQTKRKTSFRRVHSILRTAMSRREPQAGDSKNKARAGKALKASGTRTDAGVASVTNCLAALLATGFPDPETVLLFFQVLLCLSDDTTTQRSTQSRRAETRARISAALRGRKRPPEVCQRIAASLRGRSLSDAHRRRIQASLSGERNPMFGRRRSEEERARIRESVLRTLEERGRKSSKAASSETQPADAQALERPDSINKQQHQRSLSKEANSLPLDELVQAIWLQARAAGALLEHAERQVLTEPSNASYERRARIGRDNGFGDQTSAVDKRMDAAAGYMRGAVESPALSHPVQRSAPSSAHLVYTSADLARRTPCTTCNGRGLVLCPHCVKRFGHSSKTCSHCGGSGMGICDHCQGTHVVMPSDANSYRT